MCKQQHICCANYCVLVIDKGLTLDDKIMSCLYNIAADTEGHPDNVAPAIFGGIQIGINVEGKWVAANVNLPSGMTDCWN